MSDRQITRGSIIAGLVLTFSVIWPVASSDARPSTRSYTCAGLKDLIRKRGSVVMNYKGNSLYRRFVSNVGQCKYPDNRTRRFRVPSRDGTCTLKLCYEFVPFDRR